MWCKIRVQLHCFTCGYPVFPAPFIEKIDLSPLVDLCTLVNNHLTLYVRICFWVFYSISWTICLSLCQYHTVLITVLKSGSVSCPTLFYFFKIVLAIWGFLQLPYEFYFIYLFFFWIFFLSLFFFFNFILFLNFT